MNFLAYFLGGSQKNFDASSANVPPWVGLRWRNVSHGLINSDVAVLEEFRLNTKPEVDPVVKHRPNSITVRLTSK